jgi:L-lactate dehydrogenase complex protein LldG
MTDMERAGDRETWLKDFTAGAERASSAVHRCADEEEIAALVTSLAGDGPISASPSLVVRYPWLVERLGANAELILPETAAEAARATVGIALGEALVVENGSVLVSEYVLGDRIVSMLSPVLVQVVDADDVLVTLDEVGELLARSHGAGVPGYRALVTGPSRSADIERSLTVGVQGPASLHVVIFGGARATPVENESGARREAHPNGFIEGGAVT